MTANKNYTNPALTTASFIIIIAGVMYAQTLITQLLLALFIGIICIQPIRWLQSKKVPKGAAIALVLLFITTLFLFFGGLIGKSLSSFSNDAPLYANNLRQIRNSLFEMLNARGFSLDSGMLSKQLDPGKIMGLTATFLGQLGGFMGNAFTIFFLVLFLLLEADGVVIKISAVVLDKESTQGYIGKMVGSIRHYLSIKTLTSLLTGLLIYVALLIVGVDYAILWALLAFLLNYIPNIGSILAALPALLFSLVQLGVGGAVWTMIIFLVVNVVVGNVVEPKVMGKGLGLSTFVIFFALIFWGFVLGTIGMFLSVPLTMIIKIILNNNPATRPIAIFLGTEQEAKALLEEKY
ncbi:AI-2E family transporter [Reichenbachiella sp.]|uniref:AI-2E family transporter n=1 Tax=Reichenbachiella sp. TaxID=2184521 RepID=UPI003B5C0CB3